MKPKKKVVRIELNDEEKMVLDILKKESKMALEELKNQSGLSNKKWDKTIKGLTGNNLAKVVKTDDSLMVEIV
jgi:lysyl-tRNA synthetase class 2